LIFSRPVIIAAVVGFGLLLLVPLGWMAAQIAGCSGHFLELAHNIGPWVIFGRFAWIAGMAALIALLIGGGFALALDKADFPGRKWCFWLFPLPLLLTNPIQAIAWAGLVGEKGLLVHLVHDYLGRPLPWHVGQGNVVTVFSLALTYFPLIVLLALCGLAGLDGRQEDSALLSGSALRTLRRISLPLIRPHLAAGGLLVFMQCLCTAPMLSSIGKPVHAGQVLTQLNVFHDAGMGVPSTLVLILLVMALMVGQHYLLGNRRYFTIDTGRTRPVLILRGVKGWMAGGFAWSVLAVAAGLPIAWLVLQTSWADAAAAWHASIQTIFYTACAAALSATFICAVGLVLAGIMVLRDSVSSKGVGLMTVLPLGIPALVLGMGLTAMQDQWFTRWLTPFFLLSFLLLVAAYSVLFMPYAVLTLQAAFRQLGAGLHDATTVFGASCLQNLRRVYLPVLAPAICSGWAIVFVLCMSELGANMLLMPPGKNGIALTVYMLLHYRSGGVAAGLGLILTVINSLIVLTVVWGFGHRWLRRGG
jgi:iron(III) transport system permease protein